VVENLFIVLSTLGHRVMFAGMQSNCVSKLATAENWMLTCR